MCLQKKKQKGKYLFELGDLVHTEVGLFDVEPALAGVEERGADAALERVYPAVLEEEGGLGGLLRLALLELVEAQRLVGQLEEGHGGRLVALDLDAAQRLDRLLARHQRDEREVEEAGVEFVGGHLGPAAPGGRWARRALRNGHVPAVRDKGVA